MARVSAGRIIDLVDDDAIDRRAFVVVGRFKDLCASMPLDTAARSSLPSGRADRSP
jgi:hypothetical protein